MNKENINLLIDKHPQGALAYKGSLLFRPILDIPICYFNSIDEHLIEKAINQTHGASGPSNIDEQFFRHMCSRRYKEEDSNLKQGIAALARKLASVTTDPSSLEAFTVGRFKKLKYYQIFATSGLSVVPKVK